MTKRPKILVYNTLTRRKEVFEPIHGNRVYMYVCGQTPYDDAHMGHAKNYVNYDVIVRWLRYRKYSVFYIQNITDIEDKIIRRANEKGISWQELVEFYTKRFFEDMEALKVKQNVNLYPKSSDYIPEIIEQIQELINKGYAYVVDDGTVYFNVPKFEDYTKLSGMKLEELKKHRIEPDPRKKSPLDFALWKAAKPGEPSWPSPWGPGRPGWHIEDTAMAITHFGPQFDIHGGATELIFPHHTNEIAQAEALTGKKPYVKYWLHVGVMNMKAEKMSKSIGNVITIREVLSKYDPEVVRLYLASTHYRKPVEFSWDDLELAKERLERLYTAMENLINLKEREELRPEDEELLKKIEENKKEFENSMDDDFNTPKAIAVLFEMAKEMNRFASDHDSINREIMEKVLSIYRELGSVLGILEEKPRKEAEIEFVENLIQIIVDIREELRKMKAYDISDRIREELRKTGIELQDTPEGPRWKFR
ncbi:MAG: cysteine--tRNA ligase [Thermoproteota archaeon]|nr:MAG: cysteine--tRNA ligase [Candidatus Korarchaeota archaeon]